MSEFMMIACSCVYEKMALYYFWVMLVAIVVSCGTVDRKIWEQEYGYHIEGWYAIFDYRKYKVTAFLSFSAAIGAILLFFFEDLCRKI